MILVSVINHNALPVTKESDNNIYVDHYTWTFQVLKKSKRVGYPNILNLEMVTLTGITNISHSTHNHNTFWVSTSAGYLIKRLFQKNCHQQKSCTVKRFFFFLSLRFNRKNTAFLFVLRTKKNIFIYAVYLRRIVRSDKSSEVYKLYRENIS